MALTSLEKSTIGFLKEFGVSLPNVISILGRLRDEDQQLDLLEWMVENPTATEGAIIAQAKKLAEE